MKTLYCKKADLVLISRFGKKTYKPEFHLYFLPTRDYTRSEVEMKIREKGDQILERLKEKFKTQVKMIVKEYPVEEINVKGEKYDLILTDSGAISMEKALIIEI